MIQATDLRIGNIIEANGPAMEVKAIYSDHVELYLHGSEADNWDEDLEACNGIPLTSELLKRIAHTITDEGVGFESLHYRFALNDVGDGLYLRSYFAGGYIWGLNDTEIDKPVPILYLHQLQNLYYSLAQTELTLPSV